MRDWIERIGRGAATFSLTRGRANLYPETPVRLQRFKAEIDAREWLIREARHSLDESGYTTALECETAPDRATA